MTPFADRPTATFHAAPVAHALPLDLLDERAVRDAVANVRPDVILLAAAEPDVERCEREPEQTRRVNVDAARPIAEEAERNGALQAVLSSEYVFDGTKGRYAEEDRLHPLNQYGRQKVELEGIARVVRRHLVCRTSGVFGLEPAEKNSAYQLVRSLCAGRPFAVPRPARHADRCPLARRRRRRARRGRRERGRPHRGRARAPAQRLRRACLRRVRPRSRPAPPHAD